MNIIEGIGRMFAPLTDAFPTRIPQETTDDFVLPSERGGLPLSKKILPTIWIVILIAFTVIGLISPAFGAGTWRKRANMPAPRAGLRAAVVNDKIYAIGGWDARGGDVEMYDPATDTWTKKANMPTKRSGLSVSEVNGKIYVIGGATVREVFSTVEEYNPTADTWTKKANMPTKRASLSASEVNGKIYVIGGTADGKVMFPTVEEYDPKTDTWTQKASMPTKRACLSTAVVNGKIYVIGGFRPHGDVGKALSTVEVYDPVTNTWARKSNMPTPRFFPSTSVVNGKIYAIGGTTITQGKRITVSTVEVYNPATGRWTKGPAMIKRRAGHAAGVVQGRIYVIGGVSDSGAELSSVEELDTGYAVNAKDKLPTLWGEIKRSR